MTRLRTSAAACALAWLLACGARSAPGALADTDAPDDPAAGAVRYPDGIAAGGDTYSAGVMLYARGRRDEALAVLRDEVAAGAAPVYARLALGDLAFIGGDLAGARQLLEGLGTDAPDALSASAQVWLGWIDFWDQRDATATAALEAVMRALPGTAAAGEAALALGWQALLRGAYDDAARRFAALAAASERRGAALLVGHARLLEGEALMWGGRFGEAKERFAEIADRFRWTTLVDDAERDAAWCEYRTGETGAARRRLRTLMHDWSGSRARAARAGDLAIDWATTVERGPVVWHDAFAAAYRRRRPGLLPLEFVLMVDDRFAAPDARKLLRLMRTPDPAAEADGAPARVAPERRARDAAGVGGLEPIPERNDAAARVAGGRCWWIIGGAGLLGLLIARVLYREARSSRAVDDAGPPRTPAARCGVATLAAPATKRRAKDAARRRH